MQPISNLSAYALTPLLHLAHLARPRDNALISCCQLFHMSRKTGGLVLPPYAKELGADVFDRTGYPLRLSEEDGLGYDSELRLARAGTPFHEVASVPEYRDFRLDFLVNGCWKVLLFSDVPRGEFYITKPSSRSVSRPRIETRGDQHLLPPLS